MVGGGTWRARELGAQSAQPPGPVKVKAPIPSLKVKVFERLGDEKEITNLPSSLYFAYSLNECP